MPGAAPVPEDPRMRRTLLGRPHAGQSAKTAKQCVCPFDLGQRRRGSVRGASHDIPRHGSQRHSGQHVPQPATIALHGLEQPGQHWLTLDGVAQQTPSQGPRNPEAPPPGLQQLARGSPLYVPKVAVSPSAQQNGAISPEASTTHTGLELGQHVLSPQQKWSSGQHSPSHIATFGAQHCGSLVGSVLVAHDSPGWQQSRSAPFPHGTRPASQQIDALPPTPGWQISSFAQHCSPQTLSVLQQRGGAVLSPGWHV